MKYFKNTIKISILLFSLFFLSQNVIGQYCAAGANNQNYLRINSLTFASISNLNNGYTGTGYSDFTNLSTDVIQGESNDLILELNYSSTINGVSAWVDFNDDGDFSDVGEHLVSLSNQGSNVTTSITIPANANLGSHRMRVRNSYSFLDIPCGNSSHGEVEDYTVNILLGSGLRISDIMHDDYNNFATANDSVGVQISSYYAFAIDTFAVNLSVIQPDGSIQNKSVTYYDTPINGGATIIKYIKGVDFTQGDNYEITAVTTTAYNPGVDNYSRTEIFEQAPFSTPYNETIATHSEWWNTGNNFSFNGSYFYRNISGSIIGTMDSLISPSFEVSDDKLLLYYNASSTSLTTGDTVFVQIAEVGQAFINVDTLVSGYNGYNVPVDLASYDGKRIQVQFRLIKGSLQGNNTRLYIRDLDIRPYYYDFNVSDIDFPAVSNCGSAEYPLKVLIHNNGNRPQSNTNVEIRVYGTIDTTIVGLYADEILPGESKWVEVGTMNATNIGNYEVIATVIPTIDSNANNDVYTRTAYIVAPEPLVFDLNSNFTNYNWDNNGFQVQYNYIYSNNTYRGDTNSITTYFRIGEITSDAELHFNYSIYSRSDDNSTGNFMGGDDFVNVYIANDFYGTYNKVATIDSSDYVNSNGYERFSGFDLSIYEGKNISLKFEVINGNGLDSTNRVRLNLDDIYIGKPTVDIDVNSITSGIDAWCGDDSNTFVVDLTNHRRFDAYNVPLRFEFIASDGSEYEFIQYIDTIVGYQNNLTITIDTTFNMVTEGTYSAIVYTEAIDDDNANNNSGNIQLSVNNREPLPYLEDYSSNPFGDWTNSQFNYSGSYIYSDYLYHNNTAQMISPKIGEITAGSYLAFKYRVYANVGNYLRDDDSLKIYISSDCGDTWSDIYNLNHNNVANTYNWQYIPNIDLTSYTGQDIRVKIEITKDNPTGYTRFFIDDFQIVSTGDAGVISVSFPDREWSDAICGNSSEQAMVIVKNYASGILNNIPVKLSLAVDQDTTFFTATTGQIDAGSVDTVYISGIDASLAGNYNFIATTELVDDLNPNNDAFGPIMISTYETYTMPYLLSGNDISNWDDFVSSNNVGSWGYNANFFYTPNLDESDTAYIQTYKIGLIQANDELSLKIKVNSNDQNGNLVNYNLRNGDEIKIEISDDCGATFTTIETFNYNNYMPSSITNDTLYTYDLSSYIGSEVSFKILVNKNSTIGKLIVGFNEFKLAPAATQSVSLNSIYFEDEICGKANENVYAIISNTSSIDLTNFNIKSFIKSSNSNLYTDTLIYIYNGTIASGEVDTVVVGSFNSQIDDTYIVESEIFIDNESFGTLNNSFTIWGMHANNYIAANNSYQDWKYDGAYGGSWYIRSGNLGVNHRAYAYSPKVEDIAPGSVLRLYYQNLTGTFGMDDSVNIYASTDCGSTYSLIGSITNSNNQGGSFNDYAEFSLAAFNGQNVQFAIEFANGNTNTFDMRIQDIRINTTDVEILGIVTETDDFVLANYNQNSSTFNYASRYQTCGNASQPLMVVVKNTGQTDVDTINVSISYNGTSTGSLTGQYIGTVQANQKVAITLNGTIDTQTPGLVDMLATVIVDNDANAINNTIGYSVTTQTTYPVPYTAFNNTHFNENYYWNYYGNMNNTWNGVSANGLTPGDTAYAITPKLEISNNTSHLLFKYTVSNSLGEGHITSAEEAEVLISTDCGTTWNTEWVMDVNSTDFGSSSMIMLDLSSYVNQDIRIKFRGVKGNSNGSFNIGYTNIQIFETNPAAITVTYSGEDHASGATFCEGNIISLKTTNINNLNYTWKLVNADTTKTIGIYNTASFNLTLADTGKIVLEVRSTNFNNIIATDEFMINVCEIPEIVLTYNADEYPSGSAFANGNVVDFTFNSDANQNLNYNWTIDNTSIGTSMAVNRTLSSSDNGLIALELINPVSGYVVATANYNIATIDNPSFTVSTGVTTHESGAIFAETTTINLNTTTLSGMTYSWKIRNSNAVNYIASGGNVNHTISMADTGVIVLEVMKSNRIIDSAEFVIKVSEIPEIVLTFNSDELPSGSIFADGDNVDLSFNANANLNLNYNWTIANTSIGTSMAVNHTLGTSDNGFVTLEITNPASGYLVASTTYSINTIEIPTIVLKEGNTTQPSGSNFCEGTDVLLKLSVYNYQSSLNLSFDWKINSEYIGSGSSITHTLLKDDEGTISVTILSPANRVITTVDYTLTVTPLPSKPTITGHTEVVSNIKFSEYIATATFADQYLWDITEGGIISGSGTTGTVDWNNGFIGHTMISVTGYNACGLGETSNNFLVYVEYINPAGDDYNGDGSNRVDDPSNDNFDITTYPNPSNGNFTLDLPSEVEYFTVEISNVHGEIISRIDFEGSSAKINLENQATGIYHVKIITDNDVVTKPILITK